MRGRYDLGRRRAQLTELVGLDAAVDQTDVERVKMASLHNHGCVSYVSGADMKKDCRT